MMLFQKSVPILSINIRHRKPETGVGFKALRATYKKKSDLLTVKPNWC